MKNALIIHAWYNKADERWYPEFKALLEAKGYKVALPDLPELRKDQPSLVEVLKELESVCTFDEETVVIGHSLGALVALRLAEKHQLDKVVLVAGWDFNDLTEGHKLFWDKPIDHALIQSHAKKILVVHSDNDPYITASTAEDMSKRFIGEFLLMKGAGHFTGEDALERLAPLLEKL